MMEALLKVGTEKGKFSKYTPLLRGLTKAS